MCRFARCILIALALSPSATVMADAVGDDVARLQHGWANATYALPESGRKAALEQLAEDAAQSVARNAARPELMVWQAIILSSCAKEEGGLGALDRIKEARSLLLHAEKIDPTTLDGSIYTSLGSLYLKAPGWPLSFGDKDKAGDYLNKALAMNPDGIDPNFFYGELLAGRHQNEQARAHFEKALDAPPRPGREDADAGRRAEARAALDRLSRS
jgi:tetratricopeptide (TPR) repeat protein